MGQSHTLRRTQGQNNLRNAARQPFYSYGVPQVRKSNVEPLSISTKDAYQLFGATADELMPAPLHSRNSTSSEIESPPSTSRSRSADRRVSHVGKPKDTIPFPVFEDDYAANLLEPAVQVTFTDVDWNSSSHDMGRNAHLDVTVGPKQRFRTSPKEIQSSHDQADGADRLAHDKPTQNRRRNAISVLQHCDQNGIRMGSQTVPALNSASHMLASPTSCCADNGAPLMLTMHGFPYDLRPYTGAKGVKKRDQEVTCGGLVKCALTRMVRRWSKRALGA